MTINSANAIIVLHAFGTYTRGEVLTDPATIAAILSGGRASMVVQTTLHQDYRSSIAVEQEH